MKCFYFIKMTLYVLRKYVRRHKTQKNDFFWSRLKITLPTYSFEIHNQKRLCSFFSNGKSMTFLKVRNEKRRIKQNRHNILVSGQGRRQLMPKEH